MYIAIFLFTVGAAPDTLSLSLDRAVHLALEQSPELSAVRSEARAMAQAPLKASGAFLPNLSFEVAGVRTTDPVAVFGMKLRQETFAAEDLALDALNRPDPFGGFTAKARIEQPLLSPEGLLGFAAATRAAKAQSAGVSRAAGATVFRIRQGYWGAQLAQARVEHLEASLEAARAHRETAESLRDQGMVTGLDARLALVRQNEIEAQLIAARAEAENARVRLRAALGLPDTVQLKLTEPIGEVPMPACDGEACAAAGTRGDVEAARLAAESASLAARSAWASHLPSVVAFGELARHSNASPFADGSGDWTVGVALVWNPFRALAGIGEGREAGYRHRALEERRRATELSARAEQENAERSLVAAREKVEVAERGRDEAREALEQARLRYSTGVSAITELLDVEAAFTAAELNLSAARHGLLMAAAVLEFAYGVNDQ